MQDSSISYWNIPVFSCLLLILELDYILCATFIVFHAGLRWCLLSTQKSFCCISTKVKIYVRFTTKLSMQKTKYNFIKYVEKHILVFTIGYCYAELAVCGWQRCWFSLNLKNRHCEWVNACFLLRLVNNNKLLNPVKNGELTVLKVQIAGRKT